jgi:pimeloyl-ACP methyl ester carboxylesterase
MQEKLSFQNSKGDKLVGILSNPSESKENLIVVSCHGFDTTKESQTHVRIAETLNKKGIATLRFDFFGHGESDGKFEDVTISEAMDDALQAIAFVKSRGFSKVALFGSSFGGMAALLAASKQPGLKCLALKSPVSDYLGKLLADEDRINVEQWKKEGFIWHETKRGKLRLNYSFFEDAEKVSGFEAANQIKVPTLIVHGDQDDVVPVEQSRKTASLIPNCHLEIIEGAGHKYSNPGEFEKLLKLVSEFLAEHA